MRLFVWKRKAFALLRKKRFVLLIIVAGLIYTFVKKLDEEEFPETCLRFSTDLYTDVTNTFHHFVISPLSLKVVLGLIATGTEGDTYDQIVNLLCLEQEENIKENFEKISTVLLEENYMKFHGKNKLFVRNDFDINYKHRREAIDYFKTDIESINFYSQYAIKKINKWIKEHSSNIIQNVTMSISGNSSSILVNVLYYHPKWNFQSKRKLKKPFNLGTGQYFEFDVIAGNIKAFYSESTRLQAKFLKLPSKDDDITMFIALPNNINGMSRLEANVQEVFTTEPDEFAEIYVEIPQFSLETLIDYRSILQNMGIHDIFEDGANSDKMHVRRNNGIKINGVLQNIFIEINEPEVSFDSKPGSAEKQFVVDRPFMFYVKFMKEVLFVGRFFPS
ncbi:hypothetical protein ILUMI_25340 [Ignelater luminosus]|uniref:Serpin domain-containing protein n=1 Tax=Ignelater luminosus TaxID=2038154 RepID=A0A8K0C8Q6_IGNLU|nr:hypothetical protein ILUMI_25340 [Ignelater luminosus]